MTAIYPIVEGDGEVRAVPVLLRRIAFEICKRFDIEILQAHRLPRGRMLADESEQLKRAVELGSRKVRQTGQSGAIVVLLDADDDCPAELAPTLLTRVARRDMPIAVIMAKREYEAWFLAGAESLRSHRIVSDSATAPVDPEVVRDAKGYLEQHILLPSAVYRATVDQPALTAVLGLEQARSSPSFDKLCRDLCRLVAATSGGGL